jgi:hypothetical protein
MKNMAARGVEMEIMPAKAGGIGKSWAKLEGSFEIEKYEDSLHSVMERPLGVHRPFDNIDQLMQTIQDVFDKSPAQMTLCKCMLRATAHAISSRMRHFIAILAAR